MKTRLEKAGLIIQNDDSPEISISFAWSVLSRLGYPARYGGRAQDGSHEFVILNPSTGDFLATGKGTSIEMSMCQAALNASTHINTS
jgi:hypothetical protein